MTSYFFSNFLIVFLTPKKLFVGKIIIVITITVTVPVTVIIPVTVTVTVTGNW